MLNVSKTGSMYLVLLQILCLTLLYPTFDDLDRHARFDPADGEVHETTLSLRAPILGAVDIDVSEGIRLCPRRGGHGHGSRCARRRVKRE